MIKIIFHKNNQIIFTVKKSKYMKSNYIYCTLKYNVNHLYYFSQMKVKLTGLSTK